MTAFSIETLLLMAAAYFLGAMCACLLRRALFKPALVEGARGRVDPLPEVAQQKTKRFARERSALEHSSKVAPATLQRIRTIDPAVEAELKKLGVESYAQIAAWQRADLNRIEQALRLPKGRISQENWIEQAQVLASGGETHYARRWARGEAASAAPTPDEGERQATAAAALGGSVAVDARAASGGAAGVVADVIAQRSARYSTLRAGGLESRAGG